MAKGASQDLVGRARGAAAPKKRVRKPGRPSKMTRALGDRICARMLDGESLRSICRDPKMPGLSTLMRWLADPRYIAFRDQYVCAREAQADVFVDEMIDIADDGTNDWVDRERADGSAYAALDSEHIQRSKVRIETRRWIAARLAPKKYGDKLDLNHGGGVEHTGKDGGPIKTETVIRPQLTREEWLALHGLVS